MSAILALDQSTSATKALLFQTDGTLIDKTTGKRFATQSCGRPLCGRYSGREAG